MDVDVNIAIDVMLQYKFYPKVLLREICGIALHLSQHSAYVEATAAERCDLSSPDLTCCHLT